MRCPKTQSEGTCETDIVVTSLIVCRGCTKLVIAYTIRVLGDFHQILVQIYAS